MTHHRIGRLGLAFGLGLALAGCQADQPFAFLHKAPGDKPPAADAKAGTAPAPEQSSVQLVDRDVEAPDVYSATDKALWDGRPSLGGVWVAATNVTDPQRVIIRNPKNGKFVIGALFRREQMNPGPKLQLSSDAAEALGMLAGQPATISVVALKRVEAPAPAPNPSKPALDTNEAITQKPIADIKATAGAAIDKAAGKAPAGTAASGKLPAAKPGAAAPAKAPAPAKGAGTPPPPPPAALAAAPAASAPAKPLPTGSYVQLGIFSVEANAQHTRKLMKSHHVAATVVKEESHDKTFWRVLAPTTDPAGLLAKVKGLGFADAYAVTK